MDLYLLMGVCFLYIYACDVVYRFDSELTRALGEADNEREQKDKAIQESIALRAEIFSLHQKMKVWNRVTKYSFHGIPCVFIECRLAFFTMSPTLAEGIHYDLME